MIGAPGAGKSTAARALAEYLPLPLHHLDRLYWRPGWQPTPPDEWQAVQRALVQAPRWIIDGNYGDTLGIRLARAEAVLFLDLPAPVCIRRVLWRSLRLHGQVRQDLGEGCPEHFDPEFLRFVARFRRHVRPQLLALHAAAPAGQAWIAPSSSRETHLLMAEVRRISRSAASAT